MEYINKTAVPNMAKKNITVAVMSERSLEDEMKRLSSVDMKTIIIPYIAMFVFAIMALSEFNSWERILVSV